MKKSNYIVLGVMFAVSLFLLWLWWYLGFAAVDTPADLLISLAWWVVIGLVAYGIYRFERRRRQQMRTVYVSPTALFNCESGLVDCPDVTQRVSMVEDIVKNLSYVFDFEDMPDAANFAYSYIIRTEEYENAANWRGTVVKVDRSGSNVERPFRSKEALIQALV